MVEEKKTSLYDEVNDLVRKVCEEYRLDNAAFLSRDYHVLPDFHGNRSPIADPNLTGMVCGLTLSSDLNNLAILYVSTLQALAYGTRHIIDCMNDAGHHVNTLFLCGGLTKNPLFVQTHADVTGMPCVLPRESEPGLIGAAILGACASGDFATVQIDHVIETHPAFQKLKQMVEEKKTSLYDEVNDLVRKVCEEYRLDNTAFLSRDYHVLPDFHGNRSPIADPNLTGMVCGLTLSSDLNNLAVLYVSTLQALAYGTRHIIDCMNDSGHHVNTLFLCGGLTKNPLFVQTHADVTGKL
ncbi:FGGY carbohydrate kinase domain-containing protein [Exaiptasia diaphana]|nr:FGGY carbohydrate kinase domain-containing protein [Exaiptasia diaphana]